MAQTLPTPDITHPPTIDRPGWIPPHITHDWDPSPYAYQTEEELMAAGGLHGRILTYIVELVRHFIEARGSTFLVDTFMLYRDANHVKQRIAPDLLLMPLRFPPPSAYDLDEEPVPHLVIEVTSPDSRPQDLEDKVNLYLGLGIEAYLVIDAITSNGNVREQIDLYLWRLVHGQPQAILPASDGSFPLPELGLDIWAEGQRICFADAATGALLRDMEQAERERDAAERGRDVAERERDAAERGRDVAERERDTERQARLALEARLQALEAKLKESTSD
ncbi:MAG: Uma2 family endonuclease [Caldilineaceae bacterium]